MANETELDLTSEKEPAGPPAGKLLETKPFNPDENRENVRGDLARGLLWLLTFAIGGVLFFIGSGRLEGTVLTQSVFPQLITLAGTALGFYFGSQSPTSGSLDGGKAGANKGVQPKQPSAAQTQ